MEELIRHRAAVFRLMRAFLDEKQYFEVDTPQRVRTPGTDVNIEAFASEDKYLITSPEFHIKRLLAHGAPRVYQICHCFRKGEETDLHNSEFSMLEFYAAGMHLPEMMNETEALIRFIGDGVEKNTVTYSGNSCKLSGAWERLTVHEAFLKYAGWSPME
ncbi:EF-P lysine aminoacylase GenX, partial [bacterium]|nr:EF-P lysine aminoacylase GenX [bacterium]